jgi:putative thioredoxin
VKVNTDEQPELGQHFQIRSIPAVKMIREGKIVDEFVGALPEVEVRKWLEKYLPNEAKNQLEMAKAMLQAGNLAKARKILENLVKQNPANDEARILLAALLLPDEIDKAADLAATIAGDNPLADKAQAIRTLHRLAHLQETAGEPKEDWELYHRGIAAFKKGNYAEALEAWIDLVGRNRQLDDDGARKAAVALFNLLDNEHELTQKYHRRFTSSLY